MSRLRQMIRNMDKFKVLVVDDKINMRRTIRNMLRQMGISNIREAEDGDVAVERLKAEPFDFVICDWNMPRMSGVEVLKIARGELNLKDLPFVMVTAEVEEGTVAEVIEADVDGYILKPFVPRTLEDKFIQILERKQAPSPAEIHFQIAEVHMKARNFDMVHQELDEVARLSPRSPKLHYARGLAFEAQGDLDQAEQAYAMARKVGPKFIRAHEKLAKIYEKKGKTAEMMAVLKEAVSVSPKNADRQTKLGEALLAEGRVQEAKKAFNTALQIDPDNSDRMTAIGEAYLAGGMAQEAERAFKASIDSNPDNLYVYNRLGIAFRRQKKFQESVNYYKMALEIDPEEENIMYNLARAYLGIGDKNQAKEALQRALALNPDFREAEDLLLKIEESSG